MGKNSCIVSYPHTYYFRHSSVLFRWWFDLLKTHLLYPWIQQIYCKDEMLSLVQFPRSKAWNGVFSPSNLLGECLRRKVGQGENAKHDSGFRWRLISVWSCGKDLEHKWYHKVLYWARVLTKYILKDLKNILIIRRVSLSIFFSILSENGSVLSLSLFYPD